MNLCLMPRFLNNGEIALLCERLFAFAGRSTFEKVTSFLYPEEVLDLVTLSLHLKAFYYSVLQDDLPEEEGTLWVTRLVNANIKRYNRRNWSYQLDKDDVYQRRGEGRMKLRIEALDKIERSGYGN